MPRFKKKFDSRTISRELPYNRIKTNKQTNIKRGLSPKANFHDIEIQLCCCYTES